MGELNDKLAPWVEWLPAGARDFLDAGGWWVVLGVAVLVVVTLLVLTVRLLERLGGLFRRREDHADAERGLQVDLEACPLPAGPRGDPYLACYHLPVRLRLVVVASPGKDDRVDALAVEQMLDRVVPGLGRVARHDRPFIRVWPPQRSQHGFAVTFHRCARAPEPEGEPSRWVLVAGKGQAGRQPLLLGLGLWADEPTTIGRLALEPHQWLDVLRLRSSNE